MALLAELAAPDTVPLKTAKNLFFRHECKIRDHSVFRQPCSLSRKIHIAAQVFENTRVAAMHQNTSRSFLFSSITCRFAFRMNLQMAYLRRLVNWPWLLVAAIFFALT